MEVRLSARFYRQHIASLSAQRPKVALTMPRLLQIALRRVKSVLNERRQLHFSLATAINCLKFAF